MNPFWSEWICFSKTRLRFTLSTKIISTYKTDHIGWSKIQTIFTIDN